jgi:RecQ family ATP-dependent DNA helicase
MVNADYILNQISRMNVDWDVIVLKGFPVNMMEEIGERYPLLDANIFEYGKIALPRINGTQLLIKMLMTNEKSAISYESFLNMSNSMRDLKLLNKKLCIFENNLLHRIENPTTQDIPDFDAPDFLTTEYQDTEASLYYSFCSHIDGKQYVEYLGNALTNEEGLDYRKLVKPIPIEIEVADNNSAVTTPLLAIEDKSIYREMENCFYNGEISSNAYIVDHTEFKDNKELFYTLAVAAKMIGKDVHFLYSDETVHSTIRPELFDILHEVWHYEDFRNISIYKNLYQGKETMLISQGEIIETVVTQAERGLQKSKVPMYNVLLTAPTGAGKSLLFQIPAIYIAEKYGALTLVISPLVALMNDQVEGLGQRYNGVATLNSNKTVREKDKILNDVRSGKVNILYLSPELLLSYSIQMFIGERKIGLFVIDEAHTVTTWGRDFRVDYWFLGDYIANCQRVLKYRFPVFAVTATAVWDPSKKNDMVFDTIRSLNMDPCKKYIGVVRRDNIKFDITNPNIPSNYMDFKMRLTSDVVHASIYDKKKTIVYFPYVSNIYQYLRREEEQDKEYAKQIAQYHSRLDPRFKVKNASYFRSGECPVMCATKAFGMGIDVSDISIVYHFSPTGNLSDYVQEIGRLARDPNIIGIAKIDFTPQDFRFTRTLHGLSAIRHYQLNAVLKKLMELYRKKGEKRNMLITADDFSFIFPGKAVDYDQKLKSCLLLISNDLLNKFHFHSLIVRPKNLFTEMYLKIKGGKYADFLNKYRKYIKHEDNDAEVVVMDCEKLWNERYIDKSFPSFKHEIYDGKIFRGYDVVNIIYLELNLNNTVFVTKSDLEDFFKQSERILDMMAVTRKRLPIEDIQNMLPASYDKEKKETFVETFKSLYVSFKEEDNDDDDVYCNIYHTNSSTSESIQLMRHGYERVKMFYLDTFRKHVDKQEITIYCDKDSPLLLLAQLLNSLNLAVYTRSGGANPSIFVRINNPVRLGEMVRNGYYNNVILNNIYERFQYSEKIFSYFFTSKMTDAMRWDFIEDYFLGASEDMLLNYKETRKE